MDRADCDRHNSVANRSEHQIRNIRNGEKNHYLICANCTKMRTQVLPCTRNSRALAPSPLRTSNRQESRLGRTWYRMRPSKVDSCLAPSSRCLVYWEEFLFFSLLKGCFHNQSDFTVTKRGGMHSGVCNTSRCLLMLLTLSGRECVR